MTPEIFLDMLVSDLTVLLSDCLLPTKTGARRAPKVYKTIFLFRRWTMRTRTQTPRT